jgi:two-component system, LytTR family, sensor kinase
MNNMKRKIWWQILVWISLYIFFFSMSSYFQPTIQAALSSIIDTVSLLLAYLLTIHYLFPKYFKHGREYLKISIFFILVYAGLLFLIDVFVLGPYLVHPNGKPPLIFPFMRIFMGVMFTFFVGTLVRLIEQTNLLKENEKLLIEEKLETELKLLKAQINPHFIFNALNNIYSLTYMQAKTAPESVLKLSEMLRYVFYDCSKDRVSISSEIKYIENFNAFQQMKSEYMQNISLQTDLGTNNIEIAPMLFIPFIENAYKYSRIEENEDAYVNISVKNEYEKLCFTIENSIASKNIPLAGSGTGIKNVQHRLNIIYPDKHLLSIDEKDNKYRVELSINV